MNYKIFYNIGAFLALTLLFVIPGALAIHFWSPVGFSVSRVGLETFDSLTNFSKQGDGCSIIDEHLNCPLDSGVTYAPLPNPDGSTLPNLSTNTNNFTIEWDMQILSICQNDGWYPVMWTDTNASVVGSPVSIAAENGIVKLWKSGGNQIISNVLPDNTWNRWKAIFYANSSSIYSLTIAINGTDKSNIQIPSSPGSMSFQFEGDHCSINADNLTMYNGTVFPFEVFPQNASLTVLKLLYNNDTGTKNIADFTLKVNDTAVISGIPISLESGVYQVSELEDIGYNSSISGDCDASGFITLNEGENKTCIITNDDIPVLENSSLTLVKIVVNNDTCKLGPSNFTLKINDTIAEEGVPIELPPGFYNINEAENLNYVHSFLGDCDKNGNILLNQKQNKTCIVLNDDITPATIKGMKFKDLNGNGIRDVNDTGLKDWRIYIDANNNGVKDKNEVFDLTDKNGFYALEGLGQGTYIIRESPKTGWTPTYPPDGKHIVVIEGSGIVANNINFGNKK